jgi:HPt (histidine-containing phosphotransfer) domain-containing protein
MVRRKQGEFSVCTLKRSINHIRDWLLNTSPPPAAATEKGGDIWITLMPLHLQRIDWMPSPPLVPDDGPIDLKHLGRMTLGDEGLEREVLGMFVKQAARIVEALAVLPPDAPALAHTLKGAARAIGAFRVAESAAGVETAIQQGVDPSQAVDELNDAVAEARAAVEAILRRS